MPQLPVRGQLLRAQPRGESGQRDRQRRLQRLPRHPDGTAAEAVEGPVGQRQLPVAFKEGGSAFDGFSYGRTTVPTANVRHALKFQADWTVPVGRGQRYGADMNRGLDMIVGGWSINAVGRTQTVLQDSATCASWA